MAKRVLIAGVSGLVGHAVRKEFESHADWSVVGVSRRQPGGPTVSDFVAVDLTDEAACSRVFGLMSDVTHLVYAAVLESPGLMGGWLDSDLIERNAAMLRNLFEPLSRAASSLEHVTLLQGTKAYGFHHPTVGYHRLRIPLREREPRNDHPNFYFLQEDYLRSKQRGSTWATTIFRPTVVYGEAPGNNMNPTLPLAVYASLLRERGEPLYFPRVGTVPVLREAVDADLAARAIFWGATTPSAGNETFNLTNGDAFIWEQIWPAIADAFGMAAGGEKHFAFARSLPPLAQEWAQLVERHQLSAPRELETFVGANSLVYTDMNFFTPPVPRVAALNSTIKLRQAGFHECLDTEDMFRSQFTKLQESGVLPPRQTSK